MDNNLIKMISELKKDAVRNLYLSGIGEEFNCDASRFRDSRSNIHPERTWYIQIGERRGSWI